MKIEELVAPNDYLSDSLDAIKGGSNVATEMEMMCFTGCEGGKKKGSKGNGGKGGGVRLAEED